MGVTTKQTHFINKAIGESNITINETYYLTFSELEHLYILTKKALKSNNTISITLNELKLAFNISAFPPYSYYKKTKSLNNSNVINYTGKIIK